MEVENLKARSLHSYNHPYSVFGLSVDYVCPLKVLQVTKDITLESDVYAHGHSGALCH